MQNGLDPGCDLRATTQYVISLQVMSAFVTLKGPFL